MLYIFAFGLDSIGQLVSKLSRFSAPGLSFHCFMNKKCTFLKPIYLWRFFIEVNATNSVCRALEGLVN